MFTLQIETDNAAFEDDGEEVARIIRKVAARIEAGETDGRCMDANGNRVGEWELDLDSRDLDEEDALGATGGEEAIYPDKRLR